MLRPKEVFYAAKTGGRRGRRIAHAPADISGDPGRAGLQPWGTADRSRRAAAVAQLFILSVCQGRYFRPPGPAFGQRGGALPGGAAGHDTRPGSGAGDCPQPPAGTGSGPADGPAADGGEQFFAAGSAEDRIDRRGKNSLGGGRHPRRHGAVPGGSLRAAAHRLPAHRHSAGPR